MSLENVTKQLRGTRKDAENAAEAIQQQFKLIRKGGTSSVASAALRILRQLCCALQDNYHKYADIYCNIVACLMPHVEPIAAKPEYWVNHLTSLQYIHHALCQQQTNAECKRFYSLVNAQRVQLQQKTDYKFYINMHIKHFYFYGQQMQKPSTATKDAMEQLCSAMLAMGTLFETMQQQHVGYSELIGELNQILGKRSGTFLKVIGSLPVAESNKMFEPLFKLIASNVGSTESLSKQLPEYLSALQALIQIDGFAWQQKAAALQKPLAVRLLHSLRLLYMELQLEGHALQLLYYHMKLLLKRETDTDAKKTYIDLVKNWQHFLGTQCAPAQSQEQWFIDLLVLFVRLQRQMHQPEGRTNCFEHFWRSLDGQNTAEAYAAHFELLQSLINSSRSISGKSSLVASCSNDISCQSMRKHCVFSLGCCAIAAYSTWQPTDQAKLSKIAQKGIGNIFNYAVDVLKVTACMKPNSVELVNLTWHLTNIADKITTDAQLELMQRLFKPLQKLFPLLEANAMRQLLRRIYKGSANCTKQPMLVAQLQSSYIAAINCPARQFQQLCLYYRTSPLSISIYELHEQSPLAIEMNAAEKRKFYELDMLTVLSSRKTPAMLQSLLLHYHTDYHMALLGRHLRTDSKTHKKLEVLRMRLQNMAQSQRLSRLEQLVLGHVSVGKLLEMLEGQKITVSIKETAEKVLEELLNKTNMQSINILAEMPLLKLATAAIDAFAVFFNEADAEPLSSDEALIDWEALIEDILVVAMTLSTMGYTQQADAAWLLLLRIARLLGDRFNYLRALSHFTSNYAQHPLVDLASEVAHAQLLLDELWPQLHIATYYKREHSILMLCLCHMALYYARLGSMSHVQLLLLQAERVRDQFVERVGKCDIIQLTLQSVRFRICYQQRHCSLVAKMPTALQQLDTLADSVRNFTSISSVDHGALVLLLGDLVRDSTECTANRLSELPNFGSSLLQVLLQGGMVLRVVEVLISWMWTNVRMECLEKALSKLRLIEHFLCIQPSELRPSQKKARDLVDAPLDGKSKPMEELMSQLQLEQFVEPIRKQLPQSATGFAPRLDMQAAVDSRLTLQRYMEHALPAPLKSLKLQCVYFTVGCLHAHLYFLNREHDQLDTFYAMANDWLLGDKQRGIALGPMLFVLQIYQANYLRDKQKYRGAIDITEPALQLANSEPAQHRIDVNYRSNLLLQLRTAQLQLHPTPKLPRPKQRALDFNISPEKKVKASASSKKPLKIVIYTDDASPLSDATNSVESSSSLECLDLNACQLIEIIDLSDDEPTVSLKPATTTRRNASASKKLEVPIRSSSKQRHDLPEVTPKTTTIRTRGRAKREEIVEPVIVPTTVSSRRRQRN
ncbi:protein three rows [Drosophila nasuta]|uniref:protein three rows n=1 Tax=Drosophila nasuta TaxID=42062 RepID=UPI00295EEE51|nr:protein three rows [Drosophila nasuta]